MSDDQGTARAPHPGASPVNVAILAIAALFALGWSAPVAVPLTLAVLLSILLSPPVLWLSARRVPPAVAAAFVVAVALAAVAAVLVAVWGPALEWLRSAPGLLGGIEQQLLSIEGEVRELREATRRIERAAGLDDTAASGGGLSLQAPLSALSAAPMLAAQAGSVIVLLYLLLAAGDEFLRKVVRLVPSFEDKRRAVSAWREIERQVARYLATLLGLNALLGAATSLALWLLGVPNPLLWGVLVGLLHFAPYAGAVASVAVLSLVGLSVAASWWDALLVPAAYWAIAVLVGQLLAPIVLARRLSLSPVVVFLSLLLFGWLWGVAGMLMAVPIAVSVRIGCERIEGLAWVARLLEIEPAPGDP